MTNRERAIEFVFSLPQYKGVLRDREGYMKRRKECRQLVDRLEKEFDKVSLYPWQVEVTENLNNKGRFLRTVIEPAGLGKGSR